MTSNWTEHTFSHASGIDIKLDVLLPPSATREAPAPVFIWWHGGGLLQGSRKTIPPHVKGAADEHGFAIVSPDYRLCPQVRMPQVLEDVAAAARWCRDELPKVSEGRVDGSKLVYSGGSAGGHLSLLAGTGIGFKACGVAPPPAPVAIAAIYPISDLADPFWTTKQNVVSYLDKRLEPSDIGEGTLDPKSPVVANTPVGGARGKFYHYMIQEALEASLLFDGTGIDPSEIAVAPQLLAEKAVQTPPTYIVFGSIDDKVTPRNGHDVHEALDKLGVENTWDLREGLDHLFDFEQSVDMSPLWNFVKAHL